MTCPFLDYRAASDDQSLEVARTYCTAAEWFVRVAPEFGRETATPSQARGILGL